ncbi:MAG: hypothetical protein R3D62_09840 [Xanthobacteraceae bacterium]
MKRRGARPAHAAAAFALPLIAAVAVAIVPAGADMQHGYPAKPLLSTGKTVCRRDDPLSDNGTRR